MPNVDQAFLALGTGMAFGVLWRLFLPKTSLGLLAVVLVVFWALQTLSQQIYRMVAGLSSESEVYYVTGLRIVFAIAALGAAWLVGRVRR